MNALKMLSWLGHSAFRIIGSQVLYIDPYQIDDGPRADMILITHSHYDHCSPVDVAKVAGVDTVIVTEKTSAGKLTGNVRVISPGVGFTVGDVTIEAVPAYNIGKKFHPRKNGWLGFVIEMDGVRFYHAGDTDHIPEMKDLRVDVALLPVSGTYVMTAREAASAALDIAPSLAVPMHYGTAVGSIEDALELKRVLDGKIAVEILPKR